MATRRKALQGQVLLFPTWGKDEPTPTPDAEGVPGASPVGVPPCLPTLMEIVICGTFRRDMTGLKDTFEELQDVGFRVLSPSNVNVVAERDGFVFMEGEGTESPESLELRHLRAISGARLVWLHAPDGYVGPTAGFEIGFARASGIPVFTTHALKDLALQNLVTVVSSPKEVATLVGTHQLPPPSPAVQTFQAYYAKAAAQRGYEKESAQNCLLLMLEEFGELARAVRKRESLRRDSNSKTSDEAQELADVFIYIVHMANILGLDLADAVQAKEMMNIQRFLAR